MLGGNLVFIVTEVAEQEIWITNDRDRIIRGPRDHLH